MLHRHVVAWSVCGCLGLAGSAAAQVSSRTVLQTVPTSDVSHPSNLVQGDEWGFLGQAGDVITVQVDTRDDTYQGTSKLDPFAILLRPDGSFATWSDDESACSRPPVCGFACPLIQNFTLDQTGRWTIVVQDAGGATETGVFCTGGSYNLTLGGPFGVTKSLRLRSDDGSVQQPHGARAEIEKKKGPAR